MSKTRFSLVFRKGQSSMQNGQTPGEELSAAASAPTNTGDRQSAERRTNVLYLVGDARETKLVTGAPDNAFPHLNLDFSGELDEARRRLEQQGRYDVLMIGWTLPETEGLSLIRHVREQRHAVAIVAANERSLERYRQAGADECMQKDATFLARLPAAIEDALSRRESAPGAATPTTRALRVAYSGDIEFVKSAIKGESLQFIRIADALQGAACDVVVIDHSSSAATTAKTLAEVRARNLDVAVALIVNAPDESAALKKFASDVNDLIVKAPGWATRLPLRLELANSRYQQMRELAALRVREARLRSMVDDLPACIVRVSPEGTIVAVNTGGLSVLGATESRQLVRKQFLSLVNPIDRESCTDFIRRVCSGETRSIDISITTLSNERRVLEVRAIPVSAEAGGGAALALTVLRDVADRKRLEVAMEQAKAQPPAGTPSGHEAERFDENSTVVEREGFSSADPVTLRELEGDLTRLSGRARAAFDELEASLRDAEARHAEIAARQAEVTARQIEAQARLEAAQAKRWRSYDTFVEGAAHGIFHATLAGDLLDVNDAFAAALGYDSPNDLIAGSTAISKFTPEEEWRLAVEQWRQSPTSEPVEARWKRKDGAALTLRLYGGIIGGPQGDEERLEVIAENVTAQRTLDTQLRRARKWEDVARVTTGIAADLKHVIASIHDSTDLFIAGLSPDDANRDHAAAIRQGAAKALSLSSQLVAFGGREARNTSALDLNLVVRSLEGTLRRVADEHIELSLDLASDVERVEADQPTVEEVLVSLAVAGCNALPAGGRITIATTNVEVERQGAERPPGIDAGFYVLLSLSASGWGLDEDDQQGSSGTRLSSASRSLAQLGGYLHVDSAPGESLAFRVYLPQTQKAEAAES